MTAESMPTRPGDDRTSAARPHWLGGHSRRPHIRGAPRLRVALGALALLSLPLLAVILAALVAAGLRPALAAPARHRSSCGAGGLFVHTAPATQTAARIHLSRTSGAVGTLIAVSGSGWPAGDTVALRVEYADPSGDYADPNGTLATGAVGPDGAFAGVQFRLPPVACGNPPPGARARVAVQDYNASAALVAYAPFALAPSPQVAIKGPNSDATIGDALTVVGFGWTAGAMVTVTLGQLAPTGGFRATLPQPLPDAPSFQVSADGGGGFVTSVPVPAAIRPGAYVQAMASATTPEYGDLAILSPSAAMVVPAQAPTLRLAHPSGDAQTLVSLSGTNWWPGDTLTIAECDFVPCSPENPQLIPVTTVVVDPSGAFRAQLDPPTQWGLGRVVNIAVYATPYDPATSAFYLQGARYTILTPPPPPPGVSFSTPATPSRFDLGAVLGLVTLVAALAIVAEPIGRRWKARGWKARSAARPDTPEAE